MRGIIISPEYEAKEYSFKLKNSNIQPVKLRQYLLYWDKIDFPDNNIISMGSSPEINYLQGIGILNRTQYKYNFNGRVNMEKLFIDMQIKALSDNNKRNNELWSIAQPNSKLILPQETSIQARNMQVELYDCIPVPTGEVTLEDVLNFKEHRYDELMEFRVLMDDMYLSIINSGDIQLSKDMCINRLQNKIIELNRVMDESKIKRMLGSVKVELDYGKIAGGTIGGYLAGSQINFPTAGAMLGLAASFIKVSSDISLKPKKLPDELKDYAYLYYAHKELL